ncbi:hypothetical protein LINPERPRIM_LOCUS21556, partial [Linum perenne]
MNPISEADLVHQILRGLGLAYRAFTRPLRSQEVSSDVHGAPWDDSDRGAGARRGGVVADHYNKKSLPPLPSPTSPASRSTRDVMRRRKDG